MVINHSLSIHTDGKPQSQIIRIKQFDINSHKFLVTIDQMPQTGDKAFVKARCGDKTITPVSATISITGSPRIDFFLSEAMLALSGKLHLEICITNSSGTTKVTFGSIIVDVITSAKESDYTKTQSFVDFSKAMADYATAVSGTTNSTEVILARGEYSLLGDRLNAIEVNSTTALTTGLTTRDNFTAFTGVPNCAKSFVNFTDDDLSNITPYNPAYGTVTTSAGNLVVTANRVNGTVKTAGIYTALSGTKTFTQTNGNMVLMQARVRLTNSSKPAKVFLRFYGNIAIVATSQNYDKANYSFNLTGTGWHDISVILASGGGTFDVSEMSLEVTAVNDTTTLEVKRFEVFYNGDADTTTELSGKIEAVKDYTDTQIVSAKEYSDSRLESVKEYTDTQLEDLKGYIGYTGSDILGLEADFENNKFTRLGAALGLKSGSDFDKFSMYGGRKRCNVADNGTINAYYGDGAYKEDGSNGQVMVYQPAFYYKTVPLKLEPSTTGNGWNIRKARYYISSTPKAGFKLHPAFYGTNGSPVDYILYSAYEGSLFDVSASAYVNNDSQVMDSAADKLSSVTGVKPASGITQAFTLKNAEKTANNRGSDWHIENIKTLSAQQLLMVIEFGQFNVQSSLSYGVVDIQKGTASNFAVRTGSTSSLGNATGRASSSTDGENTYTGTWTTAVSYRGVENPWGNMAQLVQGINIWGNGTMKGGAPYICSDFNYSDSENSSNYEKVNIELKNGGGYISAFGYDSNFDWLFMPTEQAGTSVSPVGDYNQCATNLNGYTMPYYGGDWTNSSLGGMFFCNASKNPASKGANLGARLVYIPQGGNS